MASATHSSAPETSARKRVRLPPEVRRQQILQAALIEFSAVGFQGATMDCIAQRVGLTKAGLYAHFESKEAIFDALLQSHIFNAQSKPLWHWPPGATLEQVVDTYLDTVYTLLAEPQAQAVFRLLVTESGRMPERLARIDTLLMQPYMQQRQQEMNALIAQGLVPDNPCTREVTALIAPAMMVLLRHVVFAAGDQDAAIHRTRQAHRHLLLTLLRHA